tara:strand:- start:453 stop:950 length:498 start_codon:yes stop_codon:yes gene_type:complete
MRFIYIIILFFIWSNCHSQEEYASLPDLEIKEKVRACYLVFFEIYDVTYSSDIENKNRCIKLDYLKNFNKKELADATEKIFSDLYGEKMKKIHDKNLSIIINSYEDVSPGDSYKFCARDLGDGFMIRNGKFIVSLQDKDFNEKFLKIWVKGIIKNNKPIWNFSKC